MWAPPILYTRGEVLTSNSDQCNSTPKSVTQVTIPPSPPHTHLCSEKFFLCAENIQNWSPQLAVKLSTIKPGSAAFLPQEGRPLRQFAPLGDFCPSMKFWSENNRKISIAKEICITIDFAPPPEKNSWKKASWVFVYVC